MAYDVSNESKRVSRERWATVVPLLLFLLVVFLSPLLFDLSQSLG